MGRCYFCRGDTVKGIRCKDCKDAAKEARPFSFRTQDRIKNIDNFKRENNLNV